MLNVGTGPLPLPRVTIKATTARLDSLCWATPLLALQIATVRRGSSNLLREITLRSLELRLLLGLRSRPTILPFLASRLPVFSSRLPIFSSSLAILFVPLLCEGGGCSHRRREQEGK